MIETSSAYRILVEKYTEKRSVVRSGSLTISLLVIYAAAFVSHDT